VFFSGISLAHLSTALKNWLFASRSLLWLARGFRRLSRISWC